MPVAMATIGKTLFAHFRQVLHASAQYDQARTVFRRLKKRLEMSNLCSLSWDQAVTFSDLAHGLIRLFEFRRRRNSCSIYVRVKYQHFHNQDSKSLSLIFFLFILSSFRLQLATLIAVYNFSSSVLYFMP